MPLPKIPKLRLNLLTIPNEFIAATVICSPSFLFFWKVSKLSFVSTFANAISVGRGDTILLDGDESRASFMYRGPCDLVKVFFSTGEHLF